MNVDNPQLIQELTDSNQKENMDNRDPDKRQLQDPLPKTNGEHNSVFPEKFGFNI